MANIELLRRIAEAGELEMLEGSFDDLAAEGLVEIKMTGGGWSFQEVASLTDAGRRLLDLPLAQPAEARQQSSSRWFRRLWNNLFPTP